MPCSTHSKDGNFKECQEMGSIVICSVSSPWLDVEFFAMPMNCALPLEIFNEFQSHWGEPYLETDYCLQNLKSFGKFCSERLTRCKSKCNFSFISLEEYAFAKSQLYLKYKCIQSITHGPGNWSVPANDLRKLKYRIHESIEMFMHNFSSSSTDCSMLTAPKCLHSSVLDMLMRWSSMN
jgi:hypothetical protein